jgi:DNA-directed RNA polymerase sigma subunit (sigma70/sigma32)
MSFRKLNLQPVASLDEVAEQLALEKGGRKLSRQRIRQVEANALKKFKAGLKRERIWSCLREDIRS